jgi:Rrf2 family nitric oxide-sensitive transcriptional repressor
MKVSLSFEFALRVITFLGNENTVHTSQDVSKILGIPYNHLIKIIHKLSKSNIISSKKGRLGGVSLSKSAYNRSLYDVYAVVEPTQVISKCLSDKSVCSLYNGCAILPLYIDIQQSIQHVLTKNTIYDLVRRSSHVISGSR